ncbi:MAG TPA: glutamine-hydrolyzing carbamoyl-phosphate synthase small subunit [Acidimicrobiia bacterium]|nr:glutamine-hydrolyzing carbamoyl-phosphate synthase small subunit [Acidimicrobiia bacterium]
MPSPPGLLATADGAVFRGVSVGAEGVSTGEVVFNTAMTGYQEVLTDPSYAGQVVVMTSVHIGNYGVAATDDQASVPAAAGMVMRSLAARPSSWRAEGSLGETFAERGLVALSEVDTRRLTRHIRQRGAMPVALGSGTTESDLVARAASAPKMEGQALAVSVSTRHPYQIPAMGDRRGKVVAIDLGIKRDILRQLAGRGFDVEVVPATATAGEIIDRRPDGVFLSNGPGDPEPLTETVATLRALIGKVPIFGICLGHQVFGLALGARTFKLPFGHHGGNHPVRRLVDGRVVITSQNHGFAVDLHSVAKVSGIPGELPARVETDFGTAIPTHQNLNDGTLEGMRSLDVPAFSVQFHPEAAPGPRDAVALFDDFVELMDRA